MDKERYINLSDRQVKDTQNQSQDFLSIKTICRLLNNQDQKITDLEAKLAESEKQCQECKHLNKKIELNIKNKLVSENQELKQQLAETDKLMQEYLSKCLSLEQQLADSKKAFNTISAKHEKKSEQIFEIIKRREECSNAYDLLSEENYQLKQRLVEKEKEIEELKKGVYKVTLGTTPSNQIDVTENFYVIQNEPAIEELEKIINIFEPYENSEKDIILCANNGISFLEYINQRIKELKGEK